jgi:DNA-binding NtrC family response regulator
MLWHRPMMRVLLIDDEVEFGDTVAKVLGRRGIEVTVARDGLSGVAIASSREIDVVVLDLAMPGMDGLQTLAEIRRRDAITPVILLSGHADVARATEALKAGAADFLVKPCPIDTLIAALEDASERKAIVKELASGADEEHQS